MTREAVLCANPRCLVALKYGSRRFIGERSRGAGGRWQCQTCNQWTVIEESAPVPA